MDILINSWLVLIKEWNSIFGILSIFLLGGGTVFLWLKTLFDDNLAPGEYFVLSAGGAFLPMFLGISLSVLFAFLFGIKINFILFCLIIFIASCYGLYRSGGSRSSTFASRLPEQPQNAGDKPFFFAIFTPRLGVPILLILILIGSIFIRLAFISGLIAPLYFDSAMHYSVVMGLITNFETSTLPTYSSFVGGYYHLGFHVLIAALSLALHLDVNNVILIFGQIILVILPLPLFFIVRQETKLDAPGIFAILLAGWGWSMPAYALNWGKYPALASILAFEFVLCCLYLLLRSPQHYRWILAGILGLWVFVSAFIHTRAIILISIALVSAALALVWQRLPRFTRILLFCLVIGGILLLIFFIQSKPVLNLAFAPYRVDSAWMTLLVLLLFPFAVKESPAKTFSITLAILFLLGSLFFSVTWLLKTYDAQTLLDRPLVEMFLFLPLALLGGLGYAGLARTLNNFLVFQGSRKIWMNGLIAVVFFGAIFINMPQYKFSPSTCCQFFRDDDAVALDWMSKNVPPDATILISSFESSVFESQTPVYNSSDGGVWITPLIHRNSILLINRTDFSAQSTLDDLCKNNITHIYVGGKDESFDITKIQARPDWYQMLLHLPKAQVFKIIGCR